MSRCLSQHTTTSSISPQQVSHFTSVNPISSMDTYLITDTAIDGHTSFHTTLQVITSQEILLSYPTSCRLGIVKFTVTNEAPLNFPAMIDTTTSSKTVTFSSHIEDIPQMPHNRSDCNAKSITKQLFQDHLSLVTPSEYHLLASFQDHKLPMALLGP